MRTQRLTQPSTQLAFDTAYDVMLATVGRRDRLDEAITTMAVHAVDGGAGGHRVGE